AAPSSARLREIQWQMTRAAADAHPVFDFGRLRLHRVGGRLELRPALAAVAPETVVLVWRGEAAIDVPQWGGRLLFQPVPGLGLAPERLRAGPLELRVRAGAERFKPAPNRPSKSLKQVFQENDIPPWQRARLPLVYLEQRLVFVGGIGMDARAAEASPGIVLHWQMTPAPE
ncbi:MAG: tRNA lysidine(34) synthetase TilS, partial [Burkholderiaceae bacterium]